MPWFSVLQLLGSWILKKGAAVGFCLNHAWHSQEFTNLLFCLMGRHVVQMLRGQLSMSMRRIPREAQIQRHGKRKPVEGFCEVTGNRTRARVVTLA